MLKHMDWIEDYQLFLLDFDGLLVNTEEIHFLAYKEMCANHGFHLNWDFARYCQTAHYHSDKLREEIYSMFPELYQMQPDWNALYAEKKQIIVRLLQEGAVHLMPGVEKFLIALDRARIPRCVVTHSPKELIQVVREKHPILNTIPTWFTREHYSKPKPDPECYLKAIETLANKHDKVIGFEDTPRGLEALLKTRAQPVIICQIFYPEIPSFLEKGVKYYPSFERILEMEDIRHS